MYTSRDSGKKIIGPSRMNSDRSARAMKSNAQPAVSPALNLAVHSVAQGINDASDDPPRHASPASAARGGPLPSPHRRGSASLHFGFSVGTDKAPAFDFRGIMLAL